jgi:hypothetical protein
MSRQLNSPYLSILDRLLHGSVMHWAPATYYFDVRMLCFIAVQNCFFLIIEIKQVYLVGAVIYWREINVCEECYTIFMLVFLTGEGCLEFGIYLL